MQCYFCDRAAQTVAAIGVCQWCGGGVCGEHAREYRQGHSPAGLHAVWAHPVQLVCERCLTMRRGADYVQRYTPRRQQVQRGARQAVAELPEASAAVLEAEFILRGQMPQRTSTSPVWRRVMRWLARGRA